MATMQASLMDAIHQELRIPAREEGSKGMGYFIALDTVETFLNNCHQMTPRDTLKHVSGCISDAIGKDIYLDDNMLAGYNDCIDIMDRAEVLLNERGV